MPSSAMAEAKPAASATPVPRNRANPRRTRESFKAAREAAKRPGSSPGSMRSANTSCGTILARSIIGLRLHGRKELLDYTARGMLVERTGAIAQPREEAVGVA